MSEPGLRPRDDELDPSLERIVQDRKPGEIESGMLSGSDDDISATERFEGEVSEAEALAVLDPQQ